MVDELALGQDLPRMTHQVLQESELSGSQWDDGSVTRDDTRDGVQSEVPDLQDRGSFRHNSAQQSADASYEDDEAKWLGQVIVSSDIQCVGLVVLAVFRRQHEDRGPHPSLPQTLDDLVSIQPGEHEVQHDDVIGLLGRSPQGLFAVMGDVNTEAFGRQAALEGSGEVHFIVDDQDAQYISLLSDLGVDPSQVPIPE